MTELKRILAERKKFLAYAGGVAAGLISLGIFHGTTLEVAEAVVVLATGGGIHTVRNRPVRKPVKAA